MNITLGSNPSIGLDKEAAQHARLVDAAQQFEGMLLQEMLKGMQGGENGDGDDSGGGSNETLRSYGVEAVAHAIAQGGGIGIARQVVAKVSAEHEQRSSVRQSPENLGKLSH